MSQSPQWSMDFEHILRAHCPLVRVAEPIDPDVSLALLGVDSMRMLALIVQIEDTFDFAVPDEILADENFGTARTIWQIISDLRGTDE